MLDLGDLIYLKVVFVILVGNMFELSGDGIGGIKYAVIILFFWDFLLFDFF